MKKKYLFVVHRYAPYPGGSEYNVQRMAEEMHSRGHDVTVLTGEHKGDLNGVKVTSDIQILVKEKYDLIIVHGGDVHMQNVVHANIEEIQMVSPVLYLLVKPSESAICMHGLQYAKHIGISTMEDANHVMKHHDLYEGKIVTVPYGIRRSDSVGTPGIFRKKYGIPQDKKMFLSCGGYWAHKRMKELTEVFKKAQVEDAILVMTGYDNRQGLMPQAEYNIFPLMIEDPKEVKDAMADADFYIMHSSEEGFGLVLLEAMINKTPWISNRIAGGAMMNFYGRTYTTDDQLIQYMRNLEPDEADVEMAYDFVTKYCMINNTCDIIEDLK